MKFEFYNQLWDFDDDVELYFLHEKILQYTYSTIKNDSNKKIDRFSRIYKTDFINILEQRAETGTIEFARPMVQSYNDELFENVSDDYTMCWKRTNIEHDTLIIHLTSFAGHEGRLSSPLTNVSEKIINLDTDLLIVNEDPFRMPEILYPSNMVLGVSNKCDSIKSTCNQIRKYINKEYKHVILYADSKHAGSVVSIASELQDLNIRVLTTGGQSTYNWETSPWVKGYLKWFNRPEYLKHQYMPITGVVLMHIVKCYKFKQMNIDKRITDPYKFLNDYNIPVDFLYGKYDTDYLGFKNYVERLKINNLTMHEIDYKISSLQTHNIRPYVDRFVLKDYIENL